MILKKGKPYNPKIDYMVCKCILNEYLDEVDENHLKDCFFNKNFLSKGRRSKAMYD